MTKKEKTLVTAAMVLAAAFGFTPNAYAMHIMEGALPVGACLAWGAVSLPFLAAGFFSIQKILRENRRAITLLAMAGAFVFVISLISEKTVFFILL